LVVAAVSLALEIEVNADLMVAIFFLAATVKLAKALFLAIACNAGQSHAPLPPP
jgi:hypothetical protein